MKLFFDLETIQTQDPVLIGDIVETISHPKTIKKAESIAAWEKDKKQQAIEDAVGKTVFDGGYGEIISFGYAIEDGQAKVIQRSESLTEYDLLVEVAHVLNDLKAVTWVGHNITGFDLRYLWKRAVINKVYLGKVPHDAKPWSQNVYDTMFEWAGTGNDKKSIDFVCKALGIKGKGDMDGSKVYAAWQAGEYDKIGEYCIDDVEKTRMIYNRLNFLGE